ncbi:hypothetical protein BD626DRAFT_489686 [Schizophyllum amplum]|uniref:Putative gamma-glutamylcyclotransferase n=1 Tax=Schizophyllum amplum TaxID=97359 RepID=A0A550CIZ3_9AGAR|nr:hypothetical protein BD626DRAFT_489686 [Auriculariopsis ampla]
MASVAFFYGTLMHPKVLKLVIQNDASHLQICSAVLLDHTRHKIKGEDYPAVVPYANGRTLFTHELTQDERCVRGTLVRGLTARDLARLDAFEDDEYTREQLPVHPLSPFTSVQRDGEIESAGDTRVIPSTPPDLPETLAEPALAHTYVWLDVSRLEAELWSYADFVKHNAWKWYRDGTEVAEEELSERRRKLLKEDRNTILGMNRV